MKSFKNLIKDIRQKDKVSSLSDFESYISKSKKKDDIPMLDPNLVEVVGEATAPVRNITQFSPEDMHSILTTTLPTNPSRGSTPNLKPYSSSKKFKLNLQDIKNNIEKFMSTLKAFAKGFLIKYPKIKNKELEKRLNKSLESSGVENVFVEIVSEIDPTKAELFKKTYFIYLKEKGSGLDIGHIALTARGKGVENIKKFDKQINMKDNYGLMKTADFPFIDNKTYKTVRGKQGTENEGIGISGILNKELNEYLKSKSSPDSKFRLLSGNTGHSVEGKNRWEKLVKKGVAKKISPTYGNYVNYSFLQEGGRIKPKITCAIVYKDKYKN